MPFPDFLAVLVEPESVIDGLEEKVSVFVKFLAVVIQLSINMERHKDNPFLYNFLIVRAGKIHSIK